MAPWEECGRIGIDFSSPDGIMDVACGETGAIYARCH
jgi:hypothetical protein